MSRETTCCFTGHRPEKLPWGGNEWDERCVRLKDELLCRVAQAYDAGFRHFISGMAQGADLYFCEAVLTWKQAHPDVLLEAAIPCPEQADRWQAAQRERYRRILAQCDLETMVQQVYTPNCMMRRNRYMVDHSARIIAVYDGVAGGTMRTLAYALKQGVEIIQIDLDACENL